MRHFPLEDKEKLSCFRLWIDRHRLSEVKGKKQKKRRPGNRTAVFHSLGTLCLAVLSHELLGTLLELDQRVALGSGFFDAEVGNGPLDSFRLVGELHSAFDSGLVLLVFGCSCVRWGKKKRI